MNTQSPAVTPLDDMLCYRVDCDDRVVAINGAWTRFALANDARHLLPSTVLERVLWDLIPSAQALYAPLLYAVRAEQRTSTVRFRCDSPQHRRLFEMHIVPVPRLALEFRTRELASQSRQTVALTASKSNVVALLRMCSWCKRIDAGQQWCEPEDALARLGAFEQNRLPAVSHGICDQCAAAVTSAADGTETDAWPQLPSTS